MCKENKAASFEVALFSLYNSFVSVTNMTPDYFYPVLPLNIPLHTPVADYDRPGPLPCRIFVM